MKILNIFYIYCQHSELNSKYNVSLNPASKRPVEIRVFLLGDLLYLLPRTVGSLTSQNNSKMIINLYKRIGYNVYVYLVVNLFAIFCNCTTVGQTADSMAAHPKRF